MDKIKGKLHVSPFLLVMISFIVVILVGSFLIVTPIGQTSGKWGNYVDALFTATSATCVTGLVTYKDGIIGSLTFFGQLIVLICIQVGGLGFFTILAFVITLFKRKLEFKDRYILSQAVGSESMFALSKFVRKIILISFSFELIGALLSLPVFFQVYDKIGDVIWVSIFHSISSYNNAGFDIIGTTSLIVSPSNPILETMPQWAYIYLNFVTMFLIVAGGISFIVIIEIFSFKKRAKRWSVFTKIVLFMTTILIFGGAGIFMLTDYTTSPDTRAGTWIFAVGAGLLTLLIRRYGGMNEGASFAILLMNLLVPLIDKGFKSRPFGYKKPPRKPKGEAV